MADACFVLFWFVSNNTQCMQFFPEIRAIPIFKSYIFAPQT